MKMNSKQQSPGITAEQMEIVERLKREGRMPSLGTLLNALAPDPQAQPEPMPTQLGQPLSPLDPPNPL
jgi:hypothetical protein